MTWIKILLLSPWFFCQCNELAIAMNCADCTCWSQCVPWHTATDFERIFVLFHNHFILYIQFWQDFYWIFLKNFLKKLRFSHIKPILRWKLNASNKQGTIGWQSLSPSHSSPQGQLTATLIFKNNFMLENSKNCKKPTFSRGK